ncbi:MAG: endopeptidase La [Candidatus Comchoanobacterales bacterium]
MEKIKKQPNNQQSSNDKQFLLLPLRDVVVFPNTILPLFVGRKKSVEAVELAIKNDLHIFVATQKEVHEDSPGEKDIYSVGCLVRILEILKMPDKTMKIVVEGVARAEISSFVEEGSINSVRVEELVVDSLESHQHEVWCEALKNEFHKYDRLNQSNISDEYDLFKGIHDVGLLADLMISQLAISAEQKQKVLETVDLVKRAEVVMMSLKREMEWMEVSKRVHEKVENRIRKDQKNYIRREKLKVLQEELGDDGADDIGEYAPLEKKLKSLKLSSDTKDRIFSELKKLKMMPSISSEATVIRNFLDLIVELPWQKKARLNRSLIKAERQLDDDHYGLEKVKQRVLEQLAVQNRVKSIKGPILCLVGPPGVGKTSMGQSMAKALGRPFVRVSLGGIRDESEIRGHRRTYIGAMPGRIVKAMKRAQVTNPLIMLDEIDKIGMDYRGDPAAALLEVLDPEQNKAFNDHYLEVDYDLSDVMFVTTANSTEIPPALIDRMELIEVSGYTEDEKMHIAKKHLIPLIKKDFGLGEQELVLNDAFIVSIIQQYTREPGVRGLKRTLAKMYRKLLFKVGKKEEIIMNESLLQDVLGAPKFEPGASQKQSQVGVVQGLCWTPSGGDILVIEGLSVPGTGKLVVTGNLGDVMKESSTAAQSLIQSMYKDHSEFFKTHDIHLHVPEGAIPKEGPSAGIAMCSVIASIVTQKPLRHDVAMTGEITLRGDVLPIGGVKEKVLAAHRGGIKVVVLPEKNRKDFDEIPEEVRQSLKFVWVKHLKDVLSVILS